MTTRNNIYYWKCDRPSSFFAIGEDKTNDFTDIETEVYNLLKKYYGDDHFYVAPAGGQGNHITYLIKRDKTNYFLRLENGPENDDYMEVEAAIIGHIHDLGIPVPTIHAVDSSRQKYAFAWQIMEYLDYPDLNKIFKSGKLDANSIMYEIGTYVAQWQKFSTKGYGPYNSEILRSEGRLEGLLTTYRDYYILNMEKHLAFLVRHSFLEKEMARNITKVVISNSDFLDINQGCLVHKDLALWNILGTQNKIKAVIDWDDAISGDPTDDLSLMGCFHSGSEINTLIRGYQSIKPLPESFLPRFWLHLLRNMLFKAVIRVGAGYFKKNESFFLINAESGGGQSLRDFTLNRIMLAYEGLIEYKEIEEL